jgi:glycosyltransferase involved in cell wall biosynthesis
MIELSIIIPHYNSPALLMKLLDSIPQNDDIQVVVVDDNSKEKIEEYKQLQRNKAYETVLFLTNAEGMKGAGAARNEGLKFAKGKWVLFADADDFFLDGFYTVVKRYMQEQFEVVFFPSTSIELETGKVSDRHSKYAKIMCDFQDNPGINETNKLRYGLGVPWSKLIRRDLIERNHIRFDEVIASNDIMFSSKIGRMMTSFHVSEETIYCVTKSKGTLTQNISTHVLDARVDVFIDYYHFLKDALNAQEFSAMEITGGRFLVTAIKYKMGMKKVIGIYHLFRKNKVKVIDSHSLSLLYIIDRVRYHVKDRKKNSQYYTETKS